MKTYVATGESLPLTAPYDVAAGAGMLVGSQFAVAKSAALSGSTVEAMPRGVFDIAKAAGQAWTQGAKLYWDNTARNLTPIATSNTLVGTAYQAQAAADVVGRAFLPGLVS